jgi:hypothetical protein
MSPVMVKAYSREDSTFLFNSSQNPETWFRTNDQERFREIFPGSTTLLARER